MLCHTIYHQKSMFIGLLQYITFFTKNSHVINALFFEKLHAWEVILKAIQYSLLTFCWSVLVCHHLLHPMRILCHPQWVPSHDDHLKSTKVKIAPSHKNKELLQSIQLPIITHTAANNGQQQENVVLPSVTNASQTLKYIYKKKIWSELDEGVFCLFVCLRKMVENATKFCVNFKKII